MCMLYAFTGKRYYELNRSLEQFYGFSTKHPHGWGLASYGEDKLTIIKEVEPAYKSEVVGDIVSESIPGKLTIAHIRYKTLGGVNINNTHPFKKDINGEEWIFAHNGSVVAPELYDLFIENEVIGDTDSERVFCYIAQKLQRDKNTSLEYKIKAIEKCIKELARYGKLNLIISDGTYLFVHSNYKNSLYFYSGDDYTCITTKPLTKIIRKDKWKHVKLNSLIVYKDGKEIYKGMNHGYQYFQYRTKNKELRRYE